MLGTSVDPAGSTDSRVEILQHLTDLAVPALADGCAVYAFASDGQLERIAVRDDSADGAETLRIAAHVAATGQSELGPLGLGSYLAVPLIVRGRTLGVMTLVRVARHYDTTELAFGEELSRRVAMQLDNAMLLREVQAREAALRDEAQRLETLNRIGQELAEIHDLDQVVLRVAEAATALTGAELGLFFARVDDTTHYALCGATSAEAMRVSLRKAELTPQSSAFALKRALRMDDVQRAAAATDLGVLDSIDRIRSYLAVPVRSRRGELIGGIALGHSQPAAFAVRDEQLVTGLASLTATATDSARLFREAHELIAALEKSNRDLDQFAYVASHDLRAPLRGIANLAEWIDEDLAERITPKSREHLALLRGRVRRLESLVQGVLDYSRAGRSAEAPVVVDVGALVRDVIELVAPPAAAHIRIDPKLPTLYTARVPLEQVFLNLVGNAFKYNPKPEARLEIGAEPSSDGWEFYVRDNGPGIPKRFHAQIWNLFQTLQSRDRIESTGIGLAIVRKIVEAHGGRAWIDSEETQGATFRFTWPKDPPTSRRWDRAPARRT